MNAGATPTRQAAAPIPVVAPSPPSDTLDLAGTWRFCAWIP